jgi:integrative and conjugative element protein (TIGR02256 family)
MFSLFKRATTIGLRSGAQAKMHEIAMRADPKETGGILIGWWDADAIIIENVVEVADSNATTTSWARHEHQAQIALDVALGESPDDLLGYVGDWHSHPAVCGASSTDLSSLRRASMQYPKPLVLVVRLPNNELKFYAAKKGKICRVSLAAS